MNDIDEEPTTPFGQLVDAVKDYERWGLMLGVGIQLMVLFAMIALRVLNLAG